jgi:hypothetical protein
MKRKPITHMILAASSNDEYDNGGCDYCLIPLTLEYVSHLLSCMDHATRLWQTDHSAYNIELWDSTPAYFRSNDRLQSLHDIHGDSAIEQLSADPDPVLLAADPGFGQNGFQRVDCQTLQVSKDDLWWTACVKNTGIRIETDLVDRKTLLRIHRSLGGTRSARRAAKAVHPALQQIHDLLYLDIQDGKEFHNPDKEWDADTMAAIAEIILRYRNTDTPANQLEMLRSLDSQARTLRKVLGYSQPDEVIWRAESDIDELLIVVADGYGGASLLRVSDNYPVDYLEKDRKDFSTEEAACVEANRQQEEQ